MKVTRFLRFNAIMQTFNADIIHETECTDAAGREYTRFVIDRTCKDFDALRKELKKRFRAAVHFSTCYYKYAPEIVYNTVILANN